ncbi:MAG: hypothetical protein ACE5JI_19855, partial [Acidobacteriota bacterium]
MRSLWLPFWLAAFQGVLTGVAGAQCKDPRLVAGQVGFNVAASFMGKVLLRHKPVGRALREALSDGVASGIVAHAGYCIAGGDPSMALVGKALAQKSTLMTRRSIEARPVFDRSLYSEWVLTYSFVHFRWQGSPRVEIDAVNSAVSAYYLVSDGYHLDGKRSLYSGSLVFRNDRPPRDIRGFYAPGVIWIDRSRYEDRTVLGHELVHSLQAERGSAIA